MPYVANKGHNKARSVSEGKTFSIPTMAICVFGHAILSRPLPSFSVTAIAPISPIMKLAPVIPISACVYFSLNFSLATNVNSSGESLEGVPNLSAKSLQHLLCSCALPGLQCDKAVHRPTVEYILPRSVSTLSILFFSRK